MDYNNIYQKIVNNALIRNTPKGGDIAIETHHILPKACGGSNKKENLVNLTLKEHYICHLLLEKIYRGTEFHKKMLRAAFMMSRNSINSSRAYQKIKEEHIKNLRKQTISEKQKIAISKANKGNQARKGMKNSPEHIEALRQSKLGSAPSQETKEIWSKQRKGSIPWNKGLKGYKIENYPKTRKSKGKHSPETIEKMRLARIKYHKNKNGSVNA